MLQVNVPVFPSFFFPVFLNDQEKKQKKVPTRIYKIQYASRKDAQLKNPSKIFSRN